MRNGGRKIVVTILATIFALCALSYTVEQGCPDFMDIKGSFVQGFTGMVEDPFQTEGMVENRQTMNEKVSFDENTGGQLATIPDGELKSIRLGNDNIGGEAEAIVYHFVVDPENTLLFVNFAIVLEDPGHEMSDQPRFVVRVTDKAGNLVSDCAEYDVSAAEGIPGFQDYTDGYTARRWRDWTKEGLDLTPYANQEVQVQFITYDCALMGHFGYAYFTAHCAPNQLEMDNCSGSDITLSAPEGFSSYLWSNGDTTRTTTVSVEKGDKTIYCEVTSVTGCTFTQSAFITSKTQSSETHIVDTVCQGETYKKYNFDLPAQNKVGWNTYYNDIFDPSTCSKQGKVELQLYVIQQIFDIEASICIGDDYNENGFLISQPPIGVLYDTLRYTRTQPIGSHYCTDSLVCLRLTVNDLLHFEGTLVGDQTPCTNVATTYYIESNNAATTFKWTLPDNVKVQKGQNSPQIVLSFTDTTAGKLILTGVNGCGSTALPLDVSPRPSYHQFFNDTACVNSVYDKYNFNLGKLSTTGYYTYTQELKTKSGCDSVVVLALTVVEEPTVSIISSDTTSFFCGKPQLSLVAEANGSSIILHDCDSVPVVPGDVYCSDGRFMTLSAFQKDGKKTAEGVVFYVDTDYEYALVADLADNPNHKLTWGRMGYDIPALPNQNKIRLVLAEQDGYGNTAIMRAAGNSVDYPIAWAVDYENGWYVPAVGELWLLFSRLNIVNPVFTALGGTTFPPDDSRYSYYSSTELSDRYFCALTDIGEIMGNTKSSYYRNFLRAVKSVPLRNNLSHPVVKVGDLVENEYGEKGIAVEVLKNGRTGWMVALNDCEGSYLWYDKAEKIEGQQTYGNGTSSKISEILDSERDLNGEENTKIMQKQIPESTDNAVWSFDAEKGWFLPSNGQMSILYGLTPIIDSALVKNGGTEMSYGNYWSSTEASAELAWAFNMIYGETAAVEKDGYALKVRPFSKFTVCRPHVEGLDSSMKYIWSTRDTTALIEVEPMQTTKYTVTVTTNGGNCSATASYDVIVAQNDDIEIYDTICAGDTYKNEFFDVSESGVYTKYIENGSCRQKVVLHLTKAEEQKVTEIEDHTCAGGTYQKNGFNIWTNVSGVYYDSLNFVNRYGCDSLVRLKLIVDPMGRDTIKARVCQNEPYFEHGFEVVAYQTVGMHYYEKKVESEVGCRYIQTLALQVDSVYQLSSVDSICRNETYEKGGFEIKTTEEGMQTYYLTLQTQNGCDSVIALSLNVLHSPETHFADTIFSHTPYHSVDFDLPGQERGEYTFNKHYPSAFNSCDSVVVLHLVVLDDDEVIVVPDAFTPKNKNGKNDVFMPGYELYIYDRYGLLVTHSEDGWDGTYRGKEADAGVYIYTLHFKSGKVKRGTVEIFKE